MKISVSVDGGIQIIDLDNIDLEGYNDLLSKLSVETGLPNDAPTLLYSGNINLGVTIQDTPYPKIKLGLPEIAFLIAS